MPIQLPAAGENKLFSAAVHAFAKTYALSSPLLYRLRRNQMFYADAEGRGIFINPGHSWGERVDCFHNNICTLDGAREDGFWWFCPLADQVQPVFLGSTVIETLSLYEIQRQQGCASGVYLAMGKHWNPQVLLRLQQKPRKLILAFADARIAEAICQKHPELPAIASFDGSWNAAWKQTVGRDREVRQNLTAMDDLLKIPGQDEAIRT